MIDRKYAKIITSTFGAFSLAYVSYLTYLSAFWRIDSHHDGYVYLSAILASAGKLPPTVTNHHGIASAFIESKLLLLSSTSLLSYRFIGLAVIFLTTFLIYKIIAIKLEKKRALFFSTLWLSANPSWMASIWYVPTGIQSIWPNLWIQLLTLVVLFILFRNRTVAPTNQVVIGIALGSLPFFRIQGTITLIVLLIFILVEYRNFAMLILVSISCTTFAWMNLIHGNGGLKLYLENIISTPLSIKDYADFITLDAISINFANKFKYYLVVFFIFLIIVVGASFLSPIVKHKGNVSKRLLLMSVLILALIGLTFKNSDIWINTIYIHATTLLIDLSFPIAALYLVFEAKKSFNNSNEQYQTDRNATIILAILVLASILNQFPLSDRGHKWWSAAPSVILLAHLSCKKFDNKKFDTNLFNRSAFIYGLLIISISFSMIEGRVFQQIDRTEIQNYKFASFNGINYPDSDAELVQNLLKSVEILARLEANKVSVSYLCEDGLYYARSGGFSPAAVSGLAQNTKSTIPTTDSIVFICNATRKKHSNLMSVNDFNVYIIGLEKKDLFIATKESKLNSVLKNLIE